MRGKAGRPQRPGGGGRRSRPRSGRPRPAAAAWPRAAARRRGAGGIRPGARGWSRLPPPSPRTRSPRRPAGPCV
ncbi:MAG: hypothetical protein FJ397_11390 [Verrucomicrobia bacterium]|nr:hypothetical protein [Verrucomicrobiota bacterium]